MYYIINNNISANVSVIIGIVLNSLIIIFGTYISVQQTENIHEDNTNTKDNVSYVKLFIMFVSIFSSLFLIGYIDTEGSIIIGGLITSNPILLLSIFFFCITEFGGKRAWVSVIHFNRLFIYTCLFIFYSYISFEYDIIGKQLWQNIWLSFVLSISTYCLIHVCFLCVLLERWCLQTTKLNSIGTDFKMDMILDLLTLFM